MEIIIDDNYTLLEIQKEFSKHFPFLKLEFFEFEPDEKKIFLRGNIISDKNKTIGEIRHYHIPGHLIINGKQKVSVLEKNFRENFGINVQVYRRSGNSWLQTVSTDGWTLSEQNKKGKEMNTIVIEEKDNNFDLYHEQP